MELPHLEGTLRVIEIGKGDRRGPAFRLRDLYAGPVQRKWRDLRASRPSLKNGVVTACVPNTVSSRFQDETGRHRVDNRVKVPRDKIISRYRKGTPASRVARRFTKSRKKKELMIVGKE